MTDMFKEQKTSLERGYSRSRGELIDRSLDLRLAAQAMNPLALSHC